VLTELGINGNVYRFIKEELNMKKSIKRTIFLLLLGCILTLPAAAQSIKLHHSQGQAEMPFVLALNNGDILVVFSEGHHFNADAELMYKRYSKADGEWSDAKRAVTKFSSSAFVQMALDSVGNVHAVYMDGNSSANRDIAYCWYDVEKNKWSSRSKVYESAGVNSTWPRLRIENDILYIVWSHNYNPAVGMQDVVMVTNPVGGSWPVAKQNRITVSNQGQSVSVHNAFGVKNGVVHVCWMDDNHKPANWNIYYASGFFDTKLNDWVFKPAQHLFPSGNQYYPGMAVDDSGKPHILFSGQTGPFYYTQKSNNWTAPKIVSSGANPIFTHILFMRYAHGLLHSAWTGTGSQGQAIYYGRALPDGTWAEPVFIDDGFEFIQYPTIDTDKDGNVHVVWSDGDRNHPRHIFYAKVKLPGSAPEAVIEANPQSGLVPFKVNFNGSKSSDPDGKIVDYRWDFGDGSSATGSAKVSHTYTERGIYVATLSVIDEDFRTDSDSLEIQATTGDPWAVINVSANQGMIPLTVNFDGSESTDADGEIVSYAWDFGDGAGDTGVTVTHTYETGGEFEAKLVVTDDEGKTGSAVEDITVYQKPEAIFTADPEFGVAPLEVHFDGRDSHDVDGTITNNRWDFGDGMTAGSPQVDHTYSTPGNFTVILTVTDNDDITGTAWKVIRVLDAPLPPVNVKVTRALNRTAFYVNYINNVTWDENPGNAGLFTIAKYRIYRKTQAAADAEYMLIGEVSAGTKEYIDQGFSDAQEAGNYVYMVTAVDDSGNESDIPGAVDSSLARVQQDISSSSRVMRKGIR
jgi:PKD repeat protein